MTTRNSFTFLLSLTFVHGLGGLAHSWEYEAPAESSAPLARQEPRTPRIMNSHLGSACLAVLATALAPIEEHGLTAVGLRCEYRTDPLGIDAAQPRLSWIVTLDWSRPEADGLSRSGRRRRGHAQP